ncbi:MAG: hypothetical protein Q8N08_04320, partial [Methanobacteriaceae archaeon]|nr:hypothetical protein [Methanobacteriaceae archaeon]
DGTFEYIPLSEKDLRSRETRNFQDLKGRRGVPLSDYLPVRIIKRKVHYDPDFESFTYVDQGLKAKYLKKLVKGDYLVFYVGLTPYGDETEFISPETKRDALYLIGYFLVEEIIDLKKLDQLQNKEIRQKYSTNSHLKRSESGKEMVLIVGDEKRSKLLDTARPLSSPKLDKRGRFYHAVSPEMERLLGIKGSVQRSIPPRFIESPRNLENLMEILTSRE